MLILTVNGLAVNGSIPLYIVPKSALYNRYSRCQRQKASYTLHIAAYPLSVLLEVTALRVVCDHPVRMACSAPELSSCYRDARGENAHELHL